MEVIHPNGDRVHKEVKKYNLDELQAEIGGGYLEHLALPDGRSLLFDEDGKRKELPRNEVATDMFVPLLGMVPGDYFSGIVLVMRPEEIE